MTTISVPLEQRFVLCCITWPQYVGYSDMLAERQVRVTYDGERMEFMTVSPEHERAKHLFVLLFAVLSEEMDLAIAGFGSMTFRRKEVERGLEPDECYWIKSHPKIRGRLHIDPDRDPPPDLVLEVEISRSALDRMGIYADLGVAEVWRWNGQSLRACLLQTDGTYAEGNQSLAFPYLPLPVLEGFLRNDEGLDDTAVLRKFRKWVRQQIARKWKPTSRKKGKKKGS